MWLTHPFPHTHPLTLTHKHKHKHKHADTLIYSLPIMIKSTQTHRQTNVDIHLVRNTLMHLHSTALHCLTFLLFFYVYLYICIIHFFSLFSNLCHFPLNFFSIQLSKLKIFLRFQRLTFFANVLK